MRISRHKEHRLDEKKQIRGTRKNAQQPGYIIQDIVHKSKSDAGENKGKNRLSRTVTVVRYPIGERRVATECSGSAFERCLRKFGERGNRAKKGLKKRVQCRRETRRLILKGKNPADEREKGHQHREMNGPISAPWGVRVGEWAVALPSLRDYIRVTHF